MEDLKKTIDPVLDSAENTNPNDTNDGFEINLWDSSPIEEEKQDLSNVFSVDASEDANTVPEEPTTDEVATPLEDTEPQIDQSEESATMDQQEDAIENSQEKVVPNLSEALSSVSEPEPVNNEVVLWKFENEMIAPKDTSDAPQSFDNSVIEHLAVLDQSPIDELNAKEQEKAKLLQKAKLAQLIKTHESKAQKKWFIAGISSGIIITAWVLILAWVFAKDQVIDVLNSISGETSLSASVTDLPLIQEENYPEIIPEEENIENTGDIEEYDDTNVEENVDEYVDEYVEDSSAEDIEEYDDLGVDENINEYDNSEYVEDASSEDIEEYDNSEVDEYTESEDVGENMDYGYSITHVSSEAKANWVMPAHCYDLSCYGEDKEFTPCTTFRLSENLDENAHRIGKNWVCKYKDSSELVYVEFN